ncbi:hypothetical protein PHLCEN_2v2775 [Hermanssonia centrifuga]|uniref:Uncharacterized protein n=1 Tax=Hermanssonia centrifuga TaxID=98765 RepID=A0A2R6RHX9_9APHY|nr:hypothetical protein PHLCEN_2v2775 [Hermanssonia centrifuga]
MARRPKKRVKYQHDASSGAAESSNFGEDPILQVQGLPSMPLDILEEVSSDQYTLDDDRFLR